MEDKNIKLVNVVQVMLVRRILPCQHRACNLWEFDPAKHQTLRELFGSSHKDIWKVLFKSGKSWSDSAEDRGYHLSRPASSVSHHKFYSHNPRETLNVFSTTLLGLDEEGGADLLSGPTAGRTSRLTSDEDACHAQYATLSKRNSKVPPRIDPHIETLLQGGYHYINIT